MTVRSINEFLTEDHGRLDALLEGFQEWKVKDLAKAKGILTQFVSALHRHLQWEEAVLFPLFEQKTGQTSLIRTLLGEHQEIREWLEALSEKVGEDGADSGYEEKILVEELGGHDAREEYALYRELDKLLADEEKTQVFEAMARLKTRLHNSLDFSTEGLSAYYAVFPTTPPPGVRPQAFNPTIGWIDRFGPAGCRRHRHRFASVQDFAASMPATGSTHYCPQDLGRASLELTAFSSPVYFIIG